MKYVLLHLLNKCKTRNNQLKRTLQEFLPLCYSLFPSVTMSMVTEGKGNRGEKKKCKSIYMHMVH